ncbi:MAG: hypothetical protein QM820_10610 [Minicystis sp.]
MRAFLAFRRFFALKMGMVLAVEYWDGPKGISATIGLAAVLAASRGLAARPALAILFVAAVARIGKTFPFTINHHYLEALFLAVLALAGRPDVPTAIRAIMQMTGAVWLYAGLQKVVHGAFVTGETFALYALFDQHHRLTPSLRWLAGLGGALPPLEKAPAARWTESTVALSPASALILRASATAVVAGETLSAALLVPRVTRPFAAAALLAIQVVLVAVTGEIDIAITSTAGLLLFFPRAAPRAYLFLLIATLLVYLAWWG